MPKRKRSLSDDAVRTLPVLSWEQASEATNPKKLFKKIEKFKKDVRLWGIGRRTRKQPWPEGDCWIGVALPEEELDLVRVICRELMITKEDFARLSLRIWMIKVVPGDTGDRFHVNPRVIKQAREWMEKQGK